MPHGTLRMGGPGMLPGRDRSFVRSLVAARLPLTPTIRFHLFFFFVELPGLASSCLGCAEERSLEESTLGLVHICLWTLEGSFGAMFQGDLYAAY